MNIQKSIILPFLSLSLTLPYILLYGTGLPVFIIGLFVFIIVQFSFSHPSKEDVSVGKDREKSIVKLMESPFFTNARHTGGSAPPTQNIQNTQEDRRMVFSWIIVFSAHLMTAVFISGQNLGPTAFAPFYPTWAACTGMAVYDTVRHLKEQKKYR